MLRAFCRLTVRLSHAIDRLCLLAACVFMLVMIVMVAIQVVARYGFSAPPQWTEEIARYAMVWSALLGATVSFRRGADPVLVSWVGPSRTGRRLLPVRMAAVLIFVAPFIYFGPDFLERASIRVTESTRLPLALVESIVPLMAAIIAFHAVAKLVQPFCEEQPV
ncbi:MAG: TRAP transporter small permease subunit [Rhizomicrobium sp.]